MLTDLRQAIGRRPNNRAVMHIDRFGNLITNVDQAAIRKRKQFLREEPSQSG
jgi:S-adenosylmethionine hydrolase